MANYDTTTKIIKYSHANFPTNEDDQTAGSLAKEINDYIQSLDETKTIRSIHSVYHPTSNSTFTIIIHDSVS